MTREGRTARQDEPDRTSVEGDLDPTGYTKMAQDALQKRLVFSLNYDNGWNELDDWVYPYFHSQGYKKLLQPVGPGAGRHAGGPTRRV